MADDTGTTAAGDVPAWSGTAGNDPETGRRRARAWHPDVNHDILIDRLKKRIDDAGVIRLIRAYLNSGIMSDSVVLERGIRAHHKVDR